MKLYLVIILIIILILFIYSIKIEQFITNNINFIKKTNVRDIILKSDYFNNFTSIDLKLRNIDSNIKEFYFNNVLNYNQEEKDALTWIIEQINIKDSFMNEDWNFVKFRDLENNFPHTHLKYIFLSQKQVNDIVYNYRKKSKISGMRYLINTIIHEKVHVYQRLYPEKFDELYKLWNFSKPKNIYNIEKFKNLVRNNPDSDKSYYVYSFDDTHILMNALYNSDAKNIGDTKYIGLYLDKIDDNTYINKTNIVKELKNIQEYNYLFGNISQNYYHPNEISAELIAAYYMEKLNNSFNQNSRAYNLLKNWINFNI